MFELVLAMWCLFASWRWGDWKNIEKYYPTFLYVTVGSLMYEVIALSHFHLWKLKGTGIIGDTVAYFVSLLFTVDEQIHLHKLTTKQKRRHEPDSLVRIDVPPTIHKEVHVS
ncbi:hypothetical protein QT238_03255 [Geobacillus stearothermophilus]|nr:hypothetical protein QT238_03255 [Geobacillus stearothermophilus]